jgi:hypothetical protein
MDSLYKKYLSTKNTTDLEIRIDTMGEIIREHPKLMDYIETKIDSCYGTHKVYLVHMKVGGVDMLKVGYTKNSVVSRFAEHRYAGRENIEIVDILREEEFQAKGAIDFEKQLKLLYCDYTITTDLTLPGKGEFYDIHHKDIMLIEYDRTINSFKNVFGLKSPN